MRIILFTIIITLTSVPTIASEDLLIRQSEEAISKLSKALKQELQKSMQNGGPKNAIKMCNIKAPEITNNISIAENIEIRRVAVKYRNPENKPTEWEKGKIEKFTERSARGDNDLVAVDNGKDYFRYMKAIKMGSVCSACHGTNISNGLRKQIYELYPEDNATGFKQGEVRGAFSVKIRK